MLTTFTSRLHLSDNALLAKTMCELPWQATVKTKKKIRFWRRNQFKHCQQSHQSCFVEKPPEY